MASVSLEFAISSVVMRSFMMLLFPIFLLLIIKILIHNGEKV